MPKMYQSLLNKEVIILGCGNPLLGDDGFGSSVIKQMEKKYLLPEHIGLLDAGTSVRDLLFDLIVLENRLKTIIIIDAVNHKERAAGDIFELDLDHIPANKIADYSLHQFPSTNMLKELKTFLPIRVLFFAVQIQTIPDHILPGLTPIVEMSVKKMCELILKNVRKMGFNWDRKEYTPC